LLKKSEQAQKDMKTKVYGMIQESIKKLNLATKENIAQLNKKPSCHFVAPRKMKIILFSD